jgi:hypothetical protein
MKFALLFSATLLACAATLFVPFRPRRIDSFKAIRLWEIYADLISHRPRTFDRRTLAFALLLGAAVFTCFCPAVIVLATRYFGPEIGRAGGAGYVAVGAVAAVGAAVNASIILLSQANFAFGATRAEPGYATPYAFGLGAAQLVFAAACIAVGVSAHCASLARELLT